MNNIVNPQEGNLIFVESTSDLYFFDGTIWKSTLTSSSGGGGDGDAWNVDGEDINSVIYRNGQVYIGSFNNTNESLTVQGNAKITHLPTGTNLRQAVHYDDGTLGSDQFSRYYNNNPTDNWTTINTLRAGVTVTGSYNYTSNNVGCELITGNFQFRYFRNTNTYDIVYNTGNASIAVVTNVLRISTNTFSANCSNIGVLFRILDSGGFPNGELQIRPHNNGGFFIDMRVDSY
jgi:hypothetical protein